MAISNDELLASKLKEIMSNETKNAIRYHKRLDKAIAERTSFMSDTKWKYLFMKINSLGFSYKTQVKFLLSEDLKPFHIPQVETDFINGKYLEDSWGVCELKEIEYVFVPLQRVFERNNREEILAPRVEDQEIDSLKTCLDTGKKIEYEVTKQGMFIYGYEKK